MLTVPRVLACLFVLALTCSLSFYFFNPLADRSITGIEAQTPTLQVKNIDDSVKKHYDYQDSLAAEHEKGNAELEEDVIFQNSHILPVRQNIDVPLERLCAQRPNICTDPNKVLFSSYKVVPEHKLAACLVQKSGSTATSGAFCYLANETRFTDEGRDMMKEWGVVTLCKDNYVGRYEILQSDYNLTEEWKVMFIKRDPIDRFLSGFLDLCIQKTHLGCLGCGHNMTCFLERLLDRALTYNGNSSSLQPEEYHTFPQIWQCEVPKRLKDYTVVEYSNDPSITLLPGFKSILSAQNVPKESIDAIEKAFTSGRTAHSTVSSRYRQILERRLRSSPYLLELLVRLLYHDWIMLGFKFPSL